MRATDVRAYAFDGALYCSGCVPQAAETRCECGCVDECGACESNCHGHGPNPVFGCDELEPGDACDTCGGEL